MFLFVSFLCLINIKFELKLLLQCNSSLIKILLRTMPELPLVESFRSIAERYCLNQTVTQVEALEQGNGPRHGMFDDIVLGRDCMAYQTALLGKTIYCVHRKGKYIWMELEGVSLVMYFGMTGALLVNGVGLPLYKTFTSNVVSWPPQFTKLLITLNNGVKMAFVDQRRFARVFLQEQPTLQKPINRLGIDPALDVVPTAEELSATVSKYKTTIKALLLDQEKVFCGLGNWLVDEILYQSAIHPATPGSAIDIEKADRILKSMSYIITCSVAAYTADPVNAVLPEHWLFHVRWERAERAQRTMPDGSAVAFETHAGRTTVIVPSVQQLVKCKKRKLSD